MKLKLLITSCAFAFLYAGGVDAMRIGKKVEDKRNTGTILSTTPVAPVTVVPGTGGTGVPLPQTPAATKVSSAADIIAHRAGVMDVDTAAKRDVETLQIKSDPKTKLKASMYERLNGGGTTSIPLGNTIGTQLMAVLNGGGGRPANGDAVSRALEVLHTVIVTDAGYKATNAVPVVPTGQGKPETKENRLMGEFTRAIRTDLANGYNTANYLKAFAGILAAGRNALDDFSNIDKFVMPEVLRFIEDMIRVATPDELGVQ